MRIPLDYYRILGVPIQASAEQLQQAYRDRILQLPRREYSEMAIAARKQLIDEAYAVLRDLEQRSTYDASFLTKTFDSDANPQLQAPAAGSAGAVTTSTHYPDHPSIEIKDEQFVGALLILQELGEYELVLKLSRPYLNSGRVEIENGRFGDPKIARQDIVLTVALACLELGREQWQQRLYEKAAESLAIGQDLLLREGVFASVRGEIQSDLFKLRPYRILELLALPEENAQERRQGLQLLRDMLQERGGMDGTGNDQSGLSVDNFLRFIQQLRVYLTAAEQQTLFEEEARRPSAVATYLAVYALLARGFAQRQPTLIHRAKLILMRLAKRQDVHLEQAVCALLLGQTEEASRALELSGEYESLAFIREHSQGAPDLLPGLCLYSERWLQSEVFPHFRDLAEQEVSLKEYFADSKVQSALEALPPEPETTNEWEVVQSPQAAAGASGSSDTVLGAASERDAVSRLKAQVQRSPAMFESRFGVGAGGATRSGMGSGTSTPLSRTAGTSLSNVLGKNKSAGNVQTLPTAERVGSGSVPPERSSQTPDAASSEGQRRENLHPEAETAAAAKVGLSPGRRPVPEPSAESGDVLQRRRERKRSQRFNQWPALAKENAVYLWQSFLSPTTAKSPAERRNRSIVLAIAGVLGLAFLLLLARAVFPKRSPQPEPQVVQPAPPPPVVETPSSQLDAPGPLTPETAALAIETWFSAKAEALGQNHATEPLEQILVNPALSRWQDLARTARRDNWYRTYKHTLESESIQIQEISPDQARVQAQVREVAEHYRGNQVIRSQSYDSTLRVRYDLVRQNGQWRIREIRS